MLKSLLFSKLEFDSWSILAKALSRLRRVSHPVNRGDRVEAKKKVRVILR